MDAIGRLVERDPENPDENARFRLDRIAEIARTITAIRADIKGVGEELSAVDIAKLPKRFRSDVDEGIAFLAAEGSPEQYSVRLRKADAKRLDLISFGAATTDDVDAMAERVPLSAAKGVSVGDAFDIAGRVGSEAHDEIFRDERGYYRETNRAGGIEAGVSNGEEIVVRAAMKPLPTLMRPLDSVDLATGDGLAGAVLAQAAAEGVLGNLGRNALISPGLATLDLVLGKALRTHQTGPEGQVVKRVLVEAASDIRKELYAAVVLDRDTGRAPLVDAL